MRNKLAKSVFFASASALLIFYGFGAASFGWPPGPFLNRAVETAAALTSPPSFINDRVYDRHGTSIIDPGAVDSGLTLISTHDNRWEWRTGLLLLDSAGRVAHEWDVAPTEVFSRLRSLPNGRDRANIHGSYLFENGDVLMVVSYVGILRADACGNVLWELQNRAHHSVARAEDGTFWLPATTAAIIPTSKRYPDGYPGLAFPMHHDYLLHITEQGEVLDSLSVLDILFDNGLEQFLVKGRPHIPADPLHVNDVEPLGEDLASEYPLFDAGDLLVSVRSSDLVFVVDPETGKLKWHVADPLVHQHDPDFIGDGWIGIFDNREDGTDRGSMLGGTRIVAIQPHTEALKVLYTSPVSEPFYTPVLGKWQRLRNGNMLLTEGVTGRVIEVDSQGRTIWEWIQAPYDESHSVEVTEASRYWYPRESVASWPCASVSQ